MVAAVTERTARCGGRQSPASSLQLELAFSAALQFHIKVIKLEMIEGLSVLYRSDVTHFL